MLRLGFPVIGVSDLARATRFWSAALDYRPTPEWQGATWQTLSPRQGSGVPVGLMASASPAEPLPRLHLDLFTDSATEQEAEVERLIALGATKPAWHYTPPSGGFVVLADPDGNVFCVVNTTSDPSGTAGPTAPDS